MRTILIVTGNSDLAREITSAVQAEDTRLVVCPAVSSSEFLELLPQASLVITDLSPLVLAALPVQRCNLLSCGVRVLVLTTHGHHEHFARMLPRGTAKCLAYNSGEQFISQLRSTVARLLQAKARRADSGTLTAVEERARLEGRHGRQLPGHHLREALSRQDQLITSIAHDLRTPLTAIREFAHLMSKGMAGSFTEQQQRYVQIIERRCQDASRMVDDLLDAARIHSGRLRPYRQAIALSDVLEEVREILEPTMRHHRVNLVIDLHDSLPRVFADRDMLGRIVLNLVSNALKFSPAESVVTVRSERLSVALARTSVIDQGSGISPEDIRRIFRRFEQGSRGSIGGVGLGLSIVRHLVRLHGGRVKVESTPGLGSAFHFTLPLFLPLAIVRRHLATMAKTPGTPMTIWGFVCSETKTYGAIHRLISSVVSVRDLVLPEDAKRRILLITRAQNPDQLIGRLKREIDAHSDAVPAIRQLRRQDLKPWLSGMAADGTRPGELPTDRAALAG